MSFTYPPGAPVIMGDAVTTDRFLRSPQLVSRRLREIAQDRFVADFLLTQRMTAVGGAIMYEQGGETIYAERDPEAVAPGGEYPLTPLVGGGIQVAKVEKWGLDALVTDESIARQAMSPVERGLQKLVNSVVRNVDTVAMSALDSVVTQTVPALAPWDAGTPNILRDILLTVAKVRQLNEGIDPNVLVVDDLLWAYIASDEKIAALRARENASNPIDTGNFVRIGGLTIVSTPNLGMDDTALLVDTAQLGGMADENLGGPGYVSADGVGVQSKTIRDDDNDQWRIRARRVTVPVILEPRAAYKITGVTTPPAGP